MRLLLALSLALLALPLGAQVTVLDEGTFSHLVNGVRAGREDFSIRAARAAPGATFVAQANVLAGERRRTVVLNADSLGGPVRFQLELREANQVVSNVSGDRQRMVWSGRILTATRESAREVRLTDGSFLAEPGVVHQLWFVLRFGQGRAIELFSPSGLSLESVRLASAGPDSVQVAGRALAATRWTLLRTSDDAVAWEFWADRSGRILRARHPASGLEALRDDPPAETTGR
ncbi:MAG: hypothetical protein KF689_08885 [Gemmatimonadaceae bacterium]|nr:hypothetical protein [Gemmatimonadaceae bacterium]MCW5826289.1 hypothetical protein [Gemmatimonadaceae bacterium]